jgi:hypothetical protein
MPRNMDQLGVTLFVLMKGAKDSFEWLGVRSAMKTPIAHFERNCHATEKSEAIACARRRREYIA